MLQNPPAGPPASRRRRRSAGVLAVSAAVAVAGLGAAAPAATSAPSATCPAAYPLDEISKGQRVNGLTVTSGTVPESFTGEVIGTIDDGIAPGLDMIIAELDSAAIREAGIWYGMSGSPVYATDGSLIGAVSYGLSYSASPIAGITPAAAMHRLLKDENDPGASATLAAAAATEDVAIPRSLQRQMVSSGTAESEEVDGGMSRLRIPVGVSGVTERRMPMVKKSLGLEGVAMYRAGSAATSEKPSPPIVPGGNLAASLSYGDVSFIGTGTATAVCGDEVLAFGHPMMWTGPSELSMHNADAVFIQPDQNWGSFKVANALDPLGAVTQDRLAALLGIESSAAVPKTSAITTDVSVPKDPMSEPREDAQTFVSVQDALPEIAATHLLFNHDVVFDAIGEGSASIGWSFDVKRADGSVTTFRRQDKWANEWDISYEPTWDLFSQLWQIQNSDAEKVTITDVRANSQMDRIYKAYSIAEVRHLRDGRWVRPREDRPLRIAAGTVKRLRLTLTSGNLADRYLRVNVPIPDNAGRKYGVLNVLGGNSWYGGFGDFYGEGGGTATADLDKLIAKLEAAPRNDHVLANLRLFTRHNTVIRRNVRELAPAVVDGRMSIPVRGVLPRR